jgi:hypothetical protein
MANASVSPVAVPDWVALGVSEEQAQRHMAGSMATRRKSTVFLSLFIEILSLSVY